MAKSVAVEASSGDRRRALEAIRDSLAEAMDGAPVSVRPQVAGQLRACLAELAALPGSQVVPEGVLTIDGAKSRRAERKQSAASSVATAVEGGRHSG